VLPGIERQPRKKLDPNAEGLLGLLHRWRDEAVRAGKEITRIAVAFEAGRDGFWLARWLSARGVEAHVIHPSSVAVSREHRRAKTDRLDTELLKRGFLGWLRGERGNCSSPSTTAVLPRDPAAAPGVVFAGRALLRFSVRVGVDQTHSIVPWPHYGVGGYYPLFLSPSTEHNPCGCIDVAYGETQADHQFIFKLAIPSQEASDYRGLLLKLPESWHDATHEQQTR
jgi:hypothetical protein